jgi:hypothetical protein
MCRVPFGTGTALDISSPRYVDLGAARLEVSGVGASIVGRL